MIDNRAKNVFYHWAKHYITTEEASEMGDKANYYIIDDAAAKINNGYRFDLWDYDNDTGWGINNSGELTMTYGKEDTDYRTEGDPSSGYVFNAAECVFFCRIRNLMGSQLRTMYASCESKGCWSATSLINSSILSRTNGVRNYGDLTMFVNTKEPIVMATLVSWNR